ncbi:porin [Colwellia echini]|uniref:Porin n=1 Tax=Colwellia echini TaxID=1982103 RepID=A0ABY3MVG4_9GAMM|nr:porin [Colwellia echini]TYK65198.1 porin [Colwellia echini]
MKLVKSCIAMTICTLISTTSFAAEQDAVKSKEVTAKAVNEFYGKLNISIQSSDEDGEKFNDLKSNASRVGVKGKYHLDSGLTAIYQLEWQVNVGDDSKDSLTARNQWIGLRGDFGEITAGVSDTTLKVSQGKFDLFNDYEGDLKHLFIGENRETNSITYKSPTYKKLQFLASYIISDEPEQSDPYSIGVYFGDLNLKKTNFFLSAAHDENMPVKFVGVNSSGATNTLSESLANTRVTGMYKFGDIRLGAMLVDTEVLDLGKSETGYAVNASYNIGSKIVAKLQFQEFAGADSISVGADYKLGKETKVYAWYTDREGDEVIGANDFTYTLAEAGKYFAIGMEQKF